MKPDDDKLRVASMAASIASTYIDRVRIGSSGVDALDEAEAMLGQALSELRAAQRRLVLVAA